jgi:hypothetical protein
VPTCSITPWFITTMRSATLSASSWSCVTMMVVTPSWRCRRLISWRRLHPHDGVQCRQRLVQQQQAGRGGQRPRQRNALLLPA